MSGRVPRGVRTGGGGASRWSTDRSSGDRRWRRAAEVAAIVAVPVAVVAIVVDQRGQDPGADRAAAGTVTSASAPPTGTGPASTSGTVPPATTPPADPGRYLVELPPDAGAGTVVRTGPHSLLMRCGSGESDDRFREVSYVVPPGPGFRRFSAAVTVAGVRDTRAQAFLLVDGQVVTRPVVPAGSRAELAWSGDGLGRLALRISCDAGVTSVTFTDPRLSG